MSYSQLVADYNTSLTTLQTRLQSHIAPLHDADVPFDWPQRHQLVTSNNWTDLASLASNEKNRLELKLQQITTEQQFVNHAFSLLEQLKSGFLANHDQALADQFFTDLKTGINNSSLPASRKQELIDKYDAINTSAIKSYNHLVKEVQNVADLLDHLYKVTLSKIAYNYTTLLVCTINDSQAPRFSGNANSLFSYYRNQIEQRFETARTHIAQEDSSTANYLNSLEQYLAARIDNRILASLNHLLDTTNSTFAEKRLVSKISDLLMFAASSYFGVCWMKWNYNWHPLAQGYKTLVGKADRTTVQRILLPGARRSINTLLSQINANAGTEVLVEGIFTDFNIITLGPNKAVSRANLEHPTSGNKVGILIPYFRLNSIGLYDGAYCQLSGTYHATHVENNNQPTIVIDRANLSELAKHNFLAWSRLETRTIFEEVPHNFSINYSFGRGNVALAALIRYSVINKNKKQFNLKKVV